ncbi:MAG: hypothetical protein CI953_945 [Methanohalophilus sp.]|nr:MAG: hypothetical protein CI953_945 [Methanohalophilus sp.]
MNALSDAASTVWVKIQYPLKQGLKHGIHGLAEEVKRVKIQYPLKQGLKHRT